MGFGSSSRIRCGGLFALLFLDLRHLCLNASGKEISEAWMSTIKKQRQESHRASDP